MSHEFTSGRLGVIKSTFFPICGWTEEQIHSDQSLADIKRSDMISYSSWCTFFLHWSVTWEPGSKICALYNYLQLIYHGNWSVNYVIEEQLFLTKPWSLNPMHVGTVQSEDCLCVCVCVYNVRMCDNCCEVKRRGNGDIKCEWEVLSYIIMEDLFMS